MSLSNNRGKLHRQRGFIEDITDDLIEHDSRPAIKRRVLVINSNYQPITTISLKKAINKLFNENAVIVLPPNEENVLWQELSWGDWSDLEPKPGESVLKAACRVFKIPEIIKVNRFNELPNRKVKLSRRAIFKRDDASCQYCNASAPNDIGFDDLTIDHVLPRSQGGKTTWENAVIACTKCNRKKGDKTPEEANMPLKRKPRMPDYDVLQGRVIRVDSWCHLLGDLYWELPLKED